MDQINKALLNQLMQKIGVMKGMQLSDEEIEKSFDKSELDLIEKAKVHKYIRKEGDRYIYDEKDKHPDTQESIKTILSSSQHDQIKQNKIRDIVGDEDAARSIVAENRNKKKDRSEKKEYIKSHPQVKSVMNSLSIVNSKYSDPKKVTVEATPKGNWRIYYSGKDTGTTLGSDILSNETIMKVGWEHHSKD